MPDDRNLRGPRDASRINLNENDEVRYWADKFGVTAQDLAQAIQRPGPMSKDVEAVLASKKHK